MRRPARGVWLTSEDLADTHLAAVASGPLYCNHLTEQQVADWRLARLDTPLHLSRSRAVGALRVADFLVKSVDFWAEEVVRGIVAEASSVEDIETVASSFQSQSPNMAQEIRVAWHRALARLSEQLVSKCTILVQNRRSALGERCECGICMTVPRSLSFLRERRTRNDDALDTIEIVPRPPKHHPLGPYCVETLQDIQIPLSDASVHSSLKRFCLRKVAGAGVHGRLADDLLVLAAKNWLDSQAGVGDLAGNRGFVVHRLAVIAFFISRFVSTVRALPCECRPAAAPVAPSCDAIMAPAREILKVPHDGTHAPIASKESGEVDITGWYVKHVLSTIIRIALHPAASRNLKKYVEDEVSHAVRESWVADCKTVRPVQLGPPEHIVSMRDLRIWLAIRDLFFPTEG